MLNGLLPVQAAKREESMPYARYSVQVSSRSSKQKLRTEVSSRSFEQKLRAEVLSRLSPSKMRIPKISGIPYEDRFRPFKKLYSLTAGPSINDHKYPE